MKIILLQQVQHLGEAGEIKEVSSGYFYNFLLPRKLAKTATPQAITEAEQIRSRAAQHTKEEYQHLQNFLEKASTLSLRIIKKANEDGHLFGSVTSHDVVAAFQKHGISEVTDDDVVIPEPIKTLGSYTVSLHLKHGITGTSTIAVERGE